jgi:TAT (twin-arginine translocation) pathway signal sequence
MKSSEFIKENAQDIKSLPASQRPWMKMDEEELGEIDRRGFLKGAGAAMGAAALGGIAYQNRGKGSSGNFEGNDGVYIDQILTIRLACKANDLFNSDQFNPDAYLMSDSDTLNKTTELIKRYLQANPKMKPILEREWQLVMSNANNDYRQNPEKFFAGLNVAYKNKDRTFANFEQFLTGKDPVFKPSPKGEFD